MVGVTLWLVRHGATDWSDAGRFNGWTDVALNARGRDQARRLPSMLEARAGTPIWTSDLIRARATAAALGEACVDPRLRELDFGELEGLTWQQCEPEIQRALTRFDEFAAPGGESVAALADRIEAFISELDEGDHVLVTHGGVIRLLARRYGCDRHLLPGQVLRLGLAPESVKSDNR